MLDAVAGSAPNLLRANGTMAPATPLKQQLIVIARNTTTLSIRAKGLFTIVAKMNIAIPPVIPVKNPLNVPSNISLLHSSICRLTDEHRQEHCQRNDAVDGLLKKSHYKRSE